MKSLLLCLLVVVMATYIVADGELWEEDDHEVLIRTARGAKSQECRYTKGSWSECDLKSNQRTRTLTLKKGNQTSCEPSKTIQKKCKKACRYEKGQWGDCNSQSEMTRTDKLKPGSDPSCEMNRQITKKCKAKAVKATKGKKAPRRNRQ